ncbi:MAG TPA: hypothetical protein VEJ18_10685, partial [Planctomycetota bacterium]|nr:hypothetical protein [Planctomycetota bacterium]
SVSSRAAQALRRRGVEVVHAREDGRFASPVAGRIRDLARTPDLLRLAPEAELLLNLAREAQLVAEVIEPALRRGACVITDRTSYSHVALARHVRGLSSPEIDAAASLALRGRRPDRVFLIDVDPDVARWRRRLRKLREARSSESGRKGLLGEALASLGRRAFLELAADGGWTVVDNTWRTLDDTVRAVMDALDGRGPAGPGPDGFRPDPDDLVGSYLDFLSRIGDRGLAGMLAAGLEDPRAEAIRRAAPPDVGAYAVTGLDTAEAWALRDAARTEAPAAAARSLAGLAGPRADAMRDELAPVVPEAVLQSLAGDPTAAAAEMRDRLFGRHADEAVRSVRGLDDPPAWSLRRRAGPSPAVAESLAGVAGAPADGLRAELRGAFPLPVLRGTRSIGTPEAWSLRRELAPWAPKAVLASIDGMDGTDAHALRASLADRTPEEVAASLTGLDGPEAWRLREALADAAPAGTIKSLRKVDPARAAPWVDRIAARHGERLRVAREALQFRLRPGRVLR